MWLWIKRWRDWVMNDVLPVTRLVSQQALHYSYEKAGLKVDNQPIAWSAEAVLVEATVVRLPASGRGRADFKLLLPGQDPVTMLMMMAPLIVLFEGSILLAAGLDRRAARAAAGLGAEA